MPPSRPLSRPAASPRSGRRSGNVEAKEGASTEQLRAARRHARPGIGDGGLHGGSAEWLLSVSLGNSRARAIHTASAVCGSLAASLAAGVAVASAGRAGYPHVRSVRVRLANLRFALRAIFPYDADLNSRGAARGESTQAGGRAGGRVAMAAAGATRLPMRWTTRRSCLTRCVHTARRRGNPNPHARGPGEVSIAPPVVWTD